MSDNEWRPVSSNEYYNGGTTLKYKIDTHWYVVDYSHDLSPVAICPRGRDVAEEICQLKQTSEGWWGAADEAVIGQIENWITESEKARQAAVLGGNIVGKDNVYYWQGSIEAYKKVISLLGGETEEERERRRNGKIS